MGERRTNKCPDWQTLLAWTEGDERERDRELRKHVQLCSRCRERLSFLDAVEEALRE